MRKLLLAGALLLTSSSVIAQPSKWVLWYEATSFAEGRIFSIESEPVLETNTLLDCHNAREAQLAAEGNRSNHNRVNDIVGVQVEGTKISIVKQFHCYMYGYDPRFNKR